MTDSAMPRLPDWPTRLAAHLDRWRDRPFKWGGTDCAFFAAQAVQAVTGRRVELLWLWWDAESAAELLRQLGGLEAAVDRVLPRLSPRWAMRGDVLLVRGRHDHLAIADADGWVAPGAQGLVRGPMEQAGVAWGVGHG